MVSSFLFVQVVFQVFRVIGELLPQFAEDLVEFAPVLGGLLGGDFHGD
jgi:hypothetical protein